MYTGSEFRPAPITPPQPVYRCMGTSRPGLAQLMVYRVIGLSIYRRRLEKAGSATTFHVYFKSHIFVCIYIYIFFFCIIHNVNKWMPIYINVSANNTCALLELVLKEPKWPYAWLTNPFHAFFCAVLPPWQSQLQDMATLRDIMAFGVPSNSFCYGYVLLFVMGSFCTVGGWK